ncbi:MAG: hypothetical protein OXH57_13360 [Ekhidna sp.]|nr:hypothetical protein [Ekhidna sp.]
MKRLISSALVFSFLFGFSQSAQKEYLEAKRQFSLGNYSSAQLSFKSLVNDNTFGAYSSFYYALSGLKQGNKKEAYDMFLQIVRNYPKWNKIEEVNYWLSHIALSLKKYQEGFTHIERLSDGLKESLLRNQFSDYTVDDLKKIHEIVPDNRRLANYLIKGILAQPYSERDYTLLSHLSNKFNIDVMGAARELKVVKKNKYAIAAVLPFMYESLENPWTVIKNSVIFNLYQGMKMAQNDLKKDGILLEIFPIDTKKQRSETQKIISDRSLENADVIIGPLYEGPNDVMDQYSKENEIPMINPLSFNSEIVKDNPYSFLFKPSYHTQGKVAAVYAKENFKENKLAYILYENRRDSIVASAYKEEIEKEGFLVVRFEQMTNESARQIQKDFTEKYEFRLDTMYTAGQLDSIDLLPGRYVKKVEVVEIVTDLALALDPGLRLRVREVQLGADVIAGEVDQRHTRGEEEPGGMGILNQVQGRGVGEIDPCGISGGPVDHHAGGDLGRHQQRRGDVGDASDGHDVQHALVIGQRRLDNAVGALALDRDIRRRHVPVRAPEHQAVPGDAQLAEHAVDLLVRLLHALGRTHQLEVVGPDPLGDQVASPRAVLVLHLAGGGAGPEGLNLGHQLRPHVEVPERLGDDGLDLDAVG